MGVLAIITLVGIITYMSVTLMYWVLYNSPEVGCGPITLLQVLKNQVAFVRKLRIW